MQKEEMEYLIEIGRQLGALKQEVESLREEVSYTRAINSRLNSLLGFLHVVGDSVFVEDEDKQLKDILESLK